MGPTQLHFLGTTSYGTLLIGDKNEDGLYQSNEVSLIQTNADSSGTKKITDSETIKAAWRELGINPEDLTEATDIQKIKSYISSKRNSFAALWSCQIPENKNPDSRTSTLNNPWDLSATVFATGFCRVPFQF